MSSGRGAVGTGRAADRLAIGEVASFGEPALEDVRSAILSPNDSLNKSTEEEEQIPRYQSFILAMIRLIISITVTMRLSPSMRDSF